MYEALVKGQTRIGKQLIDLEIATQEQLKLIWDAEEVSGTGHQAVKKVEKEAKVK